MRRSPIVFDGPILSYRAFRIGAHGTLRSMTGRTHWGPTTRTAHCERRLRTGDRPHAAPDRRCDCGVYGVSSIALAKRAAAHTDRFLTLAYSIAIGGLVAAAIACALQPSWLRRAQGAALLLLAIGTAIGYVRSRRSIVYGAIVQWGDQVALDVVAGGVQIRSQFARPIALVSSPAADRIGARMGLPVAPERSIAAVAREISDGEEIDPALLARRGPIDWVGWGLWMIALGVLRLGFLIAYLVGRSIVFAAALLSGRRPKEV